MQRPSRLRKAILHVSPQAECSISGKDSANQICCTSTVLEGKACKVNVSTNFNWKIMDIFDFLTGQSPLETNFFTGEAFVT